MLHEITETERERLPYHLEYIYYVFSDRLFSVHCSHGAGYTISCIIFTDTADVICSMLSEKRNEMKESACLSKNKEQSDDGMDSSQRTCTRR